jgi:hypothetical protein
VTKGVLGGCFTDGAQEFGGSVRDQKKAKAANRGKSIVDFVAFNRYGFISPQLAAQWRCQVFLKVRYSHIFLAGIQANLGLEPDKNIRGDNFWENYYKVFGYPAACGGVLNPARFTTPINRYSRQENRKEASTRLFRKIPWLLMKFMC